MIPFVFTPSFQSKAIMKKNVNLRHWKPEDKAQIIEIFRLNTPEYFAHEEEKELVFFLDYKTEAYFVAEFEQKVIGCGGIHFSEDLTAGHLSWDILHPDFQGMGIGGMLLMFRIEKLFSVDSVQKVTVRTSQLAWKFYEKFGFVLKYTQKDYWAEGFDLYFMEYVRK